MTHLEMNLNSLRLSFLIVQVTEKLRERADKNEPDKDDFVELAKHVEEFTLRFLDPLKYDDLPDRRLFALNPKLNVLLETAIKLEQKKVIPLIS